MGSLALLPLGYLLAGPDRRGVRRDRGPDRRRRSSAWRSPRSGSRSPTSGACAGFRRRLVSAERHAPLLASLPSPAPACASCAGSCSQDAVIRSALALTLVAIALFPAAARADTFTVTTTADTAGAAGCTILLCTIRNAIGAAGATATTDDVINVPAGAYTLDPQFGALSVPTGITIRRRRERDGHPANLEPSSRGGDQRRCGRGPQRPHAAQRQRGDGRTGGNLQALAGASVALTRVRLFNGRATRRRAGDLGRGRHESAVGLPEPDRRQCGDRDDVRRQRRRRLRRGGDGRRRGHDHRLDDHWQLAANGAGSG